LNEAAEPVSVGSLWVGGALLNSGKRKASAVAIQVGLKIAPDKS
jgi:hypothetical protein